VCSVSFFRTSVPLNNAYPKFTRIVSFSTQKMLPTDSNTSSKKNTKFSDELKEKFAAIK
jgi:hypothetical protein